MIKIFENNNKLNIVDDRNVFVGFDYSQCCCEHFGFHFTRFPNQSNDDGSNVIDLSDLNMNIHFDVSYFETIDHSDGSEEGGAGVFKLISDDDSNDYVYLVLYNSHNGYYGHGFEMLENDKIIHSGVL